MAKPVAAAGPAERPWSRIPDDLQPVRCRPDTSGRRHWGTPAPRRPSRMWMLELATSSSRRGLCRVTVDLRG
jgi:hypothetical protein